MPSIHPAPGLACALVLSLLGPLGAANAADPAPEIRRQPLPAQADGAAFTLRVIPEACARLEGGFTGKKGQPFALAAEPSRPRCMARAQLVEAASVRPSVQRGWVLNDEIRVPSARCPAQLAVVRLWRERDPNATPKRDAQGRVRVYLRENLAPASAAQHQAPPRYAVQLAVQGRECR